MALAYVQDGAKFGESGGDGVIADTYGSSTTTGNLLTLQTWGYNNGSAVGYTSTSVSDNKSNTWAQAREHETTSGANNYGSAIYYIESAAGGATHTVTLDVTSTSTTLYAVIAEFSGATLSGALDKVNSNTASASPAVTGLTGTLSQAAEVVLIVGCFGTADATTSITVGGGFNQLAEETNDSANQAGEADYLIVAATTSLEGSWTVADPPDDPLYNACIATFIEAAAGGATIKSPLIGTRLVNRSMLVGGRLIG